MFLPDLIVRSRRVVLAGGTRSAAIHIRNHKIVGVMDHDAVPPGCPVDDAGDAAVIPGIVDTHVRISTAGDENEGSASTSLFEATRAAAAGGVTTLVVAPARFGQRAASAAALETMRRAARGRCMVDVGFWAAVVPLNVGELATFRDSGTLGFYCSVGTLLAAGSAAMVGLQSALPVVAKSRAPLLVDVEPHDSIDVGTAKMSTVSGWLARLHRSAIDAHRYSTYLATRPRVAENGGVVRAIELCRTCQVRTHVVHLSSHEALTPLYHARASRLPITAETCPHYLTFVAEDVPDGATAYKCVPPIRERENREYLWAALAGGLISSVASDHSPVRCSPEDRRGDFLRAASGISTLPLSLPATWTEASARGYSLDRLVEWMCRAPAALAELGRKGAIDVGYDADLVVWNPEAEFTAAHTSGSERSTPYAGRRLRGVVERTYLRGTRVYERGRAPAAATGELLRR